jgi:phage terminase large subunit-like protein
VGRKCGKTLLASAVIAYEAFCDGEFGSEIYCIAPKLDQSDLVYSAFEFTVSKNPEFERRIRKRKTDYIIDQSNTIIKRLAFNEKKADGYNPMLTVADEMSSWPAERGLKQWEVMISGTGARTEPITLAISSGGYINDGPYDELFKRGTRFLMGEGHDKRLLPVFYTIDDIEKWDDINELRKSLPGMGESVPIQFLLDEIDVARDSLSKRAEFITKYACLKQNSSLAWLDTTTVNKCFGDPLNIEDFRSSYCVAGLDLSQTTDLTSANIVVEKGRELYVFAHFWLPAERIDEATARDGLPYQQYIDQNIMSLSGDNFVDYHDCFDWLTKWVEDYEILPLQVGYDRYSATYLVQALDAAGIQTDDVYQGTNLTPVIRITEGLMKDGKINIGDNDLLKIHFLNSALKTETETERVRLIKIEQRAHIDGMAAFLDAMTMRDKYWKEIGSQLINERRQ